MFCIQRNKRVQWSTKSPRQSPHCTVLEVSELQVSVLQELVLHAVVSGACTVQGRACTVLQAPVLQALLPVIYRFFSVECLQACAVCHFNVTQETVLGVHRVQLVLLP